MNKFRKQTIIVSASVALTLINPLTVMATDAPVVETVNQEEVQKYETILANGLMDELTVVTLIKNGALNSMEVATLLNAGYLTTYVEEFKAAGVLDASYVLPTPAPGNDAVSGGKSFSVTPEYTSAISRIRLKLDCKTITEADAYKCILDDCISSNEIAWLINEGYMTSYINQFITMNLLPVGYKPYQNNYSTVTDVNPKTVEKKVDRGFDGIEWH